MSLVIDIFSWVLLVVGGFFCCVGALGLLRMPDFYTRMHAASVIDTLGAGLTAGTMPAGCTAAAGTATIVAAATPAISLRITSSPS